jgi:hypothetical protein
MTIDDTAPSVFSLDLDPNVYIDLLTNACTKVEEITPSLVIGKVCDI